jgi:hypothetical protein
MGRPKPTRPPKEKKVSKKQVEPSTFEEFMEGITESICSNCDQMAK